MVKNRFVFVTGTIVAAGLLASCGSTVPGSAKAQAPAAPTSQQKAGLDPCSLLTPEQTAALGLRERGEPSKADSSRNVPPGCRWKPSDPESDMDALSLNASTEFSLATYTGGKPSSKQFELGGLTWKRFPSMFGAETCQIGHAISDKSFVMLLSTNYDDAAKACELSKKAAPLVASHLPGGNQNPTLPSTTESPPSPLARMEPCDVLGKKQLETLGVSPQGRKTGKSRSGTDTPPGCEWEQTEDNQKRLLYVVYLLDEPKDQWDPPDDELTGTYQTAGRTWNVYHPYGTKRACAMILPVTKTSAVEITGGNDAKPDEACAQLKSAAEMITPKIPKG